MATAASLWLASTFGTSFLPSCNEGTITVFLSAPPGTSLEESDRLAQAVDRQLVEVEGVRAVVRRTGRAERDEHAEPACRSEIDVSLKPGYGRADVLAKLDAIISKIPGINAETGQHIEHRLSHILSGTPAAIAISVYGEDLTTLRRIAKEVEAALKQLPGTRDVAGNREAMIRTLPIRYRHDDLRRFGLTPGGAAEQVHNALFGEMVTEANEGIRRYDVVVRLDPAYRQTPQHVQDLVLRGKGGATVRLSEVADIGPEDAAMAIQRENAQRKAVISTNVAAGYNRGHLVEQVQATVDPIVARHGSAVHYGGQFEAQQSAARTIYLMGGGVIVVILLLLYTAFGSLRAALLVMVNLPLALIGGVLAIYFTESEGVWRNALALFGVGGRYQAPVISIASMVGFVALFGIAVRNGILLVNHYQHLMAEEGVTVAEAVVQGSMERLVPILMTALAAVLGLVPLVIAAGEPGSELLAPLAVVVLGGLVTSTFLDLVVVPAGSASSSVVHVVRRRTPPPRTSRVGTRGRRWSRRCASRHSDLSKGDRFLKNFIFATCVGIAVLSSGCKDDDKPQTTTSGGAAANTSSGGSIPAATQQAATPEHHRPPIGEPTMGGLELVATMDAPIKASGGGEGAFDVVITGGKPKAVRFWIGNETGDGSVRAKADEETTDSWHTHAEVPDPLPPGSKFWVEVEPPTGETFTASFDLK